MEPTTILPAQTTAVTAAVPYPIDQRFLPATIMATNLAGSESVAILFSVDGGLTFEPLSQDGVDMTLVETRNTLAITAPLLIGVTKSVTASASGVFVMLNQKPDFDGFRY